MPSKKFEKIAKDILSKDKEMFDTLMEFEKTKKIRSKTRMNFTIDKSIASRFSDLCRNKNYNMSGKIQSMIQELINKESV